MADSASRRDFLKGRAALGALREKVGQALDANAGDRLSEWPSDNAAHGPVLTLKRRAMACDFEARLNLAADENDTLQALDALDLVERIESQITVYRDASEVMAINRTAAAGPVEVEPRLFEVLWWMDRLHGLTGGAYDGTSGPLSAVWGFFQRKGRVPSEGERRDALANVCWGGVKLNEQCRTVAFDRAGLSINLNSVGKGYALDRAAEVLAGALAGDTSDEEPLEAEPVRDFLLHGGRSTLVARGSRRRSDRADGKIPGDGWGVGLRHPLRSSERIAEFRLRDAAFSTSGSGTQSFVHRGKRYGHLIDPRTGWPAEGLHSVSVVAPTGAEADALSTALYVLGADAGAELLAENPQWGALFVEPGGRAGAVRLRDVNLPEGAWRPLSPG